MSGSAVFAHHPRHAETNGQAGGPVTICCKTAMLHIRRDWAMQERDTLTVAAEGATRLRIKNQEILAKEEQVRALLASNRAKLDSLLGTRGKGVAHRDSNCGLGTRQHAQTSGVIHDTACFPSSSGCKLRASSLFP